MFTFLRTETHEQKYKVRLSAKTTNMHELNSNWNSKFHKKKGKIFRAMDISGDEITLKVAVRDTYTAKEIQDAITTLGLSDLTIKEEDLNYGAFEGEKNGLTKDQFDSFEAAFSAVTDNLTKPNQAKITPLQLQQGKDNSNSSYSDKDLRLENREPTKNNISQIDCGNNRNLDNESTQKIQESEITKIHQHDRSTTPSVPLPKDLYLSEKTYRSESPLDTGVQRRNDVTELAGTSQSSLQTTQRLTVGPTNSPTAVVGIAGREADQLHNAESADNSSHAIALPSIIPAEKKGSDGLADKVAIDGFNQRMASLFQTKKTYEELLQQEEDKLSETKQEIERLTQQQHQAVTVQNERNKLQKDIDDNNAILNATQQELGVSREESDKLAGVIQKLKTSLDGKKEEIASIQNKAFVIVSPGTIPLPDGNGSVASGETMTKAQNNHPINAETTDLLAQLQEKLNNKTTEKTALENNLAEKQQLYKQAADDYSKYPTIYAFFESIGVFFRRLFGSAATTRKDKLREQKVEHKKQIDLIEKKLNESEQTIVAITTNMNTLQSLSRDIEKISTQLKSASDEQTIIQGTITTLQEKETKAKTFSIEKQQELEKRNGGYLAVDLSDSKLLSLGAEQQQYDTMVRHYKNLLRPFTALQEDDYAVLDYSTKADILCPKVARLTAVERVCAVQKGAILPEASSSEKPHQLPSTNQSQPSNSRPPPRKKTSSAQLSSERPTMPINILQAIKQKEGKTNQTKKSNSVVKLTIACGDVIPSTISKEKLQEIKSNELNKGIPGSDALHIAYIFFNQNQAYYTHDGMNGPALLEESLSAEFKQLKELSNKPTSTDHEISRIKALLSDYTKGLFGGDATVQATINYPKKEPVTLVSLLRSSMGAIRIQTKPEESESDTDTESQSGRDFT